MSLRPGDRIDRYVLVRPLGEGGQGAVWQVVDPLEEGAQRALKIVRLAEAGQAAFTRARREAKILAHLEHPGLCACHGLFEDLEKGLVGVVLDLVEGASLDSVMRDPRLGKGHRYAILSQIAEVLAYVHAAGLAHRDLKPSNVLITDGFWEKPDRPGTVKLVDFGIAVPIGNPQRLTSVGGVIGTVRYLSPELFDAKRRVSSEESCARDLFAFGVIAWELFFDGHPAGLGPSASFEAMAQRYADLVAGGAPFPPKTIPGAWGPAIACCLALRPEDRPENGAALLDVLRTGRRPPPRRAEVAEMPSRTQTHEPAPSVRTNLPPTITSEPSVGRTAPMVMPSPPAIAPPPRTRERPAPRMGSGPVYALALAVAALAAAIYWRPTEKTSDERAPPPMLSATAAPSNAIVTPSPDPTRKPPPPDGACCGGIDCRPPKKNVRNSYCETTERTQCTKCASGRTYVPGECAKFLPEDGRYLLRLASVGSGPSNLRICYRRANDPTSLPVCLAKSEGSDVTGAKTGPAFDHRLSVTTKDLTTPPGIEITIKDERGEVYVRQNAIIAKSLKVTALCVGVPIEVGQQNTRVAFYLDEPIPSEADP